MSARLDGGELRDACHELARIVLLSSRPEV
jgi:hypothetical protein